MTSSEELDRVGEDPGANPDNGETSSLGKSRKGDEWTSFLPDLRRREGVGWETLGLVLIDNGDGSFRAELSKKPEDIEVFLNKLGEEPGKATLYDMCVLMEWMQDLTVKINPDTSKNMITGYLNSLPVLDRIRHIYAIKQMGAALAQEEIDTDTKLADEIEKYLKLHPDSGLNLVSTIRDLVTQISLEQENPDMPTSFLNTGKEEKARKSDLLNKLNRWRSYRRAISLEEDKDTANEVKTVNKEEGSGLLPENLVQETAEEGWGVDQKIETVLDDLRTLDNEQIFTPIGQLLKRIPDVNGEIIKLMRLWAKVDQDSDRKMQLCQDPGVNSKSLNLYSSPNQDSSSQLRELYEKLERIRNQKNEMYDQNSIMEAMAKRSGVEMPEQQLTLINEARLIEQEIANTSMILFEQVFGELKIVVGGGGIRKVGRLG